MGRRTLLLIASILVAALGTSLIWLYVQGADTRAQQGQSLVPALFLTKNLKAGASASDAVGSAVTRQVPQDVAQNAVTSLQQVQGLQLMDPATSGQLLLRPMFGQSTSTGAQPGRGIITISISDPHRVPAQLEPESHVAVYALGAKGGSLQLVIPEIKVLSVGSSMQTPSGTTSQVPVTIVGFDAAPDQAFKLANIEATGAQAQLYLLGPGTVVTQ